MSDLRYNSDVTGTFTYIPPCRVLLWRPQFGFRQVTHSIAPVRIWDLRRTEGHAMPLLGFGVFQNFAATPSVLEAFKAGYR